MRKEQQQQKIPSPLSKTCAGQAGQRGRPAAFSFGTQTMAPKPLKPYLPRLAEPALSTSRSEPHPARAHRPREAHSLDAMQQRRAGISGSCSFCPPQAPEPMGGTCGELAPRVPRGRGAARLRRWVWRASGCTTCVRTSSCKSGGDVARLRAPATTLRLPAWQRLDSRHGSPPPLDHLHRP